MKKSLLSLLLVSQLFGVPLHAQDVDEPPKKSPNITEASVKKIFGNNLDTADSLNKGFLMAIALDHTAPDSPNINQNIGIPYIIDRTPGYWGNRLSQGDETVEVLVNNALLFMFTDHGIDKSKAEKAIQYLMVKAEQKGYWPATYYLAEQGLQKHFIRNTENKIDDPRLMEKAKVTMERFMQCAGIGFAPCNFRAGFWMSASDKTLKDGISILQNAVNIAIRDTRYAGELDEMVLKASTLIVDKGAEVGMLDNDRAKYVQIIQDGVAASVEQFMKDKEKRVADKIGS